MAEATLRAYKGKQTALKTQITSIESEVNQLQGVKLTPFRYEKLYNRLEKYQRDLDDYNGIITGELAGPDEFTQQYAEYSTIDKRLAEVTSLVVAHKPEEQASIPTKNDVKIKLPPMTLPEFDGSLEDWSSFHSLFVAGIQNQNGLSDAQRLQYLKSSLKKDASQLIKQLEITDANYNEAWRLLRTRYENKREIINSHLKRLLSQPIMKEESSTSLRKLVDTTRESIQALQVMSCPTEHWDHLLVYILTEKLDQGTRRHWILSLKDAEPPSFKALLEFLDARARALFEAGVTKPKINIPTAKPNPMKSVHHGSVAPKCDFCSDAHYNYRCPEFLAMTVQDRSNQLKKHNACFNCLRQGHRTNTCPQESTCKKCGKRHNTLLHRDEEDPKVNKNPDSVTSMTTNSPASPRGILLATAVVNIVNRQGNPIPLRALLDSGSEVNLISTTCARRLGLKIQSSNVTLSGVGAANCGGTQGSVGLALQSRTSNYTACIEALTIPKVSGILPSFTYDTSQLQHVSSLKLADPMFNLPGEIDLLIGAELFWELLTSRKLSGNSGEPTAYETKLGWIISGKVNIKRQTAVVTHVTSCNVDETLQRFWEIEELPEQKHLTREEQESEDHFSRSHTRNSDGRYVVRLPLRKPPTCLGASRKLALQRLNQMEKRMGSNQKLKEEYNKFMDEYEGLGHMTRMPSDIGLPSTHYFLPHHAVLKESSTTTKLRVVFDASAKTSSGISLNNCLMVGPKLQDDIIQLLLRFRLHKVAFTADVAKMYRQIEVHQDDRSLQMILWRKDPNLPVGEYMLNTVVYGQASSSYIATRVVQQLATDEAAELQLAAAVAKQDVYMDDVMSGAASVEEALIQQALLIELFRRGCFVLRKWASNDPALLSHLQEDMVETPLPMPSECGDSVKTLGLHWIPKSDIFVFAVTLPLLRERHTKRTLLSDISKIFDPLGWLSPMTIRAKLFFQELWKLSIDWDDALPEGLVIDWDNYRNKLKSIEDLQIPRFASVPYANEYHLLGFCDASEKAYAAVVYLKSVNASGDCSVSLIAAKTRVAPVKTVSLPRLELCGAVLLCRLLAIVKTTLLQNFISIKAWSDSTIVLAWIATQPSLLKTFVANRIAEIQSFLPSEHWAHVKSQENPADVASRGINPDELPSYDLWWIGPNLLRGNHYSCEITQEILPNPLPELKVAKAQTLKASVNCSLLEKFSSLWTLTRVTAFMLRFIHNSRPSTQLSTRYQGPLTVTELDKALNCWIRATQLLVFSKEISCLQAGNEVSPKSTILSLNPFLDDGILRVGGRLKNSGLNFNQMHPVLLPRKCRLTELILDQEHKRNFHAGPQLLLASIQRKYWIIRGRDAVRHFVRRCIVCFKTKCESAQQMMGNLPAARITVARPFTTTGVDYGGPFLIRSSHGRNPKITKAYVCLFICFVTKAVHIELVTDLTTTKFLEALHRFTSRRGLCKDIYSDNGTNFVGASKELRKFYKFISSSEVKEAISSHLASTRISWHFNPPSSPHFGGLWEAGIKSVKLHLKRIVNTTLTYEEMSTVLTQIEAILNSRPLTPLSSDPNDLNALTPGHFLVGGPLNAIPEPSYSDIPGNRLDRYQLQQKMTQDFWRRWKSEYLTRLQQRPKWLAARKNFIEGDLVLLKDERLIVRQWKLGRIIKLHPGDDNLVRVITIKTADGEFKRPVVKCCLLPLPDGNNE